MSKHVSKAATPTIIDSGIAATPSGKEYYRVLVRSQEPIPHVNEAIWYHWFKNLIFK